MMIRRIAWLLFFTVVASNALGQTPLPDKRQLLASKLESYIAEQDRNFDGVLGVAILDLQDGQMVLYHADEVFPTASSIKIAMLAELYRQDEQASRGVAGNAKLTDVYVVNAADIVGGSGIMGGFTPGVSRLTNRDLATLMVTVSDNSATNVLIDRLGMDKIDALLDQLGLRQTRLRRRMMDFGAAAAGRENTSTPREMVLLLENIYRARAFDKNRTDDCLRLLSMYKDNFLSRLLPPDVVVADKPGALGGVRTDSGIVMLKQRPFAISVMSTYDGDEREAEQVIARIAAAAFRTFDRLDRSSAYGVISPR